LFSLIVVFLPVRLAISAGPYAVWQSSCATDTFPTTRPSGFTPAPAFGGPLELITPELRVQLLANGEASRRSVRFDPHPIVKWFNPCGSAAWLITELDPCAPDMAYGLIDLGMGFPEQGHVCISELAAIRLMGGALRIERDLYWKADRPLSEYARLARLAGRIVD